VHVASVLQVTLIDTVLAEFLLFPPQEKMALMKVEEFEIHHHLLPHSQPQLLYYLQGI